MGVLIGDKKMSQMNETTSKNLFEFATYFKRILQLALVAIGVTLLSIIVIAVGVVLLSPGIVTAGGIIALGVVVISVISLVFQIMMFIRIGNAKNSSPHPELVKSYTFFMISLILAGVSVVLAIIIGVISFFNPLGNLFLDILDILVGFAILICDLLAWQSLGRYIAVYGQERGNSQGFVMVAEGIKTYIITVYVSLALSALSFIVGFIGFGVTIVALASLIVSIIMFVAQFKIANGMLMIFGAQTSYSVEPTAPLAPTPTTAPSSGVEHFCKNCGAKLMPGAKFCTSCGTTLE
jgi:hypothetical protein